METLTKIRDIVANVTNNSIEKINESSNSGNVDGWDSVAQINIIVTVEMEFGVSFTAEEMHALNSVVQILDAVERIMVR